MVKTYEQFKAISMQLDDLEGNEVWKEDPHSTYYDYELIGARLKSLQKAREDVRNGDDPRKELMRILRSSLLRNLGGLGNPNLYSRVNFGTKNIIHEYITTVVQLLTFIRDDNHIPLKEKFNFFWETRQAFGRSALLLSGGASLGLYHLGVIKALFEQNLLPKVISGSSVGSIVAALVSTRQDKDLPELLEMENIKFEAFEAVGSVYRKIKRFFQKGVLMDINKLQNFLRGIVGDITFKEAYYKTKRILNITISGSNVIELPRLMNYLTAPDVLIWSAASASCALSGLYEPVELLSKRDDGSIEPYYPSKVKWSDGSVELDLPMLRLSELFNINHFIVSQVNPHVVPFISSTPTKNTILQKIKKLCMGEIKHRICQLADLNLLPKFLHSLPGLVSQKYSGDITIVPNLTTDDYLKLLSNPTREWIKECSQKTERLTWNQISLIRSHCDIEKILDDGVYTFRTQMSENVK